MNSLELMAWLINAFVACTAMPMTEQRIDGQEYQVQAWTCAMTQGPVTVRSWRRPCSTGHTTYWGRLVYVEFEQLHTSLYLSRFGDVLVGQGASLNEAYVPPCGS